MKVDKEIMDSIEEAKKHQDFRLEKMLLVFTGEICAQMEKIGINRADLAKRLQTSRAFVTKVLKCNHNITLKTMESIANALDMELSINVQEAKSGVEEFPQAVVYKFEKVFVPVGTLPIYPGSPIMSNNKSRLQGQNGESEYDRSGKDEYALAS
mgnify:CR=1 FL=1